MYPGYLPGYAHHNKMTRIGTRVPQSMYRTKYAVGCTVVYPICAYSSSLTVPCSTSEYASQKYTASTSVPITLITVSVVRDAQPAEYAQVGTSEYNMSRILNTAWYLTVSSPCQSTTALVLYCYETERTFAQASLRVGLLVWIVTISELRCYSLAFTFCVRATGSHACLVCPSYVCPSAVIRALLLSIFVTCVEC